MDDHETPFFVDLGDGRRALYRPGDHIPPDAADGRRTPAEWDTGAGTWVPARRTRGKGTTR